MKIKLLLSVALLGAGLVSCMPKATTATAATPAAAPAMTATMLDIVDTAAGNKDFSTLVAAVQAAGQDPPRRARAASRQPRQVLG